MTFIVSVLSQVMGGVGVAAQVVLGQALIARLTAAGGTHDLVGPLVAVLAVTAVVLLLDQWRVDQQRVLGEAAAAAAADELLRVVSSVPLIRFDDPSFHDRMLRAQVDVLSRPSQVSFALLTLASSTVALGGVVLVLAAISPLFIALVLVASLPAAISTVRASRMTHAFEQAQTPSDRRRQYFFFLLTGRDAAAEVRAFGLGSSFRTRHRSLHDERVAGLRRLGRGRVAAFAVGLAGTVSLLAFAILSLGDRVSSGAVTPAQAITAVAGLLLLSTRLPPLALGLGSLVESALFLEDVDRLTAEVPADPPAPTAPVSLASVDPGTVSALDVTFRYPGRDVDALREVSLSIGPGQVVALVGENGSGKSTLVKIIAGLFEPRDGRVLWDGVDRATMPPGEWSDRTAVVFQDHVRYNLTVAEVIGLGRIEQPRRRGAIEGAAVGAGASSFIDDLPGGYDAPLGPQFIGGTDLSGGQWQRLSLARALYRDAPLVVLDEPTASLDAVAEAEWFRTIKALLAGRSALVVSHRFSTVRGADHIYVMEQGRVIEHGDHDSLVELGGRYALMFRLQAAGYLETAAR
jgi:ATP-binding cassette subfamily B protein